MALMLIRPKGAGFEVRGRDIRRVLSTCMEYSATVAGEWRKGGRREHQQLAAKAVLSASDQETSGHFDWIKAVEGHGRALFRWTGDAYETKDPDPLRPFGHEDVDQQP